MFKNRSNVSTVNASKSKVLALSSMAVLSVAMCVPQAHADFDFPDFSVTSGLALAGTATVSDNTLKLTQSVGASAGAGWYATKQNVSGGFQTDFRVRIFDRKGGGADGIAFVIQNTGTSALGGQGGAIGYATNQYFSQTGISNSLAVEFDTWNNTGRGWADTAFARHTSIQTNGLNPNSPEESASLGAASIGDIGDGQIHNIRIKYVGGVLSVYVDDLATAVLSRTLDIATRIQLDQGTAIVGLTSGTGGAQDAQGHEILSWSYVGNTIPTPGAAAILGLGGLMMTRRRRD